MSLFDLSSRAINIRSPLGPVAKRRFFRTGGVDEMTLCALTKRIAWGREDRQMHPGESLRLIFSDFN